mgnify:CR=1 FL=1|tara:strand:- start:105 stop:593 length:489 start_codon:yes stop_codon:yes gene_type:complete
MTLYQTPDERWEEVEKALKQFEVAVGLGSLGPTEVDKWLNISPQKLNKMSEEDCAEASYLLTQEATFIQSQINTLQSKIDWCNRKINSIIAPIIKTQITRYMENELKRAYAVKQDDVAERLQQISNEASSYHSRLVYMPNSLRAQSDKLTKYQEIKRGQNYA